MKKILDSEWMMFWYQKCLAHFFDIFDIVHNPKIARLYAQLFYIGTKNRKNITTNINGIWPFWVQKQLNPQSDFFFPTGFQPLTFNITYRNWTTLSFPGTDAKVIVDPKGLITPHRFGWSLDFWVIIDKKLICPSQVPTISQTLIQQMPITQTSFMEKEILITSEAFLKPFPEDADFLFSKVTLENQSSKPISLSFIQAICPYNPEGVSPIEDITYVSSNAFIVNHQLGVILDQKPDNILCLSQKDGDINEQFLRLEMILNAHCVSKTALAGAEYRLTLAPKEKRVITCKIPIKKQPSKLVKTFREKLNEYQITNLKNQISDYQFLTYDKEQDALKQSWKEINQQLCAITLPEKEIEIAFHRNLNHLHNFIGEDTLYRGSFTYKEFWLRDAVWMIMSLNRIGSVHLSEKILQKIVPSFKNFHPTKELDSLGQIIFTLYDTYLYSQNKFLLEENFNAIDSIVKKISKHRIHHYLSHPENGLLPKSYSFELFGEKDLYLLNSYWALAGVRCALKIASILCHDQKIASYTKLEQELSNSLTQFIQYIFDRNPTPLHIPITPSAPIDSRLIYSLTTLYPMMIYSEYDPLITATLELIEKKFLVNHMLLSQSGQETGYSIFQNCLLAQTYLLRKNPLIWNILHGLNQKISPTGCWPEMIHPKTNGGIIGDGHDGLASASYLQLIRNLLIEEKTDSLTLTPFIHKNWISDQTPSFIVQDMPTQFGKISFSYFYAKNKITYQLQPSFHTPPKELILTLPIPIQKAFYQGTKRDVFNTQIRIPPDCPKIELEL